MPPKSNSGSGSGSDSDGSNTTSPFVLIGQRGSYRYYLNVSLKKWEQHRSTADSYNYELAWFENDAELQAVRNMQSQWYQTPEGSLGHAWIGGKIKSGEWKWQTSPYTVINGTTTDGQWQAGFGPGSSYSSGVWGNSSRAQLNQGTGVITDLHKDTLARGVYKEFHIPSDVTPPVLLNAALASTGISTTSSTVNDTISLSFEASEPLQSPVVTFAVQNVQVAASRISYNEIANNGWIAFFVVSHGDLDGDVTYTVDFSDIAANPGIPVQGGGISVDNTAPVLLSAHLSSSNAVPTLALDGDTIVLDITASEITTQPSVSFSSNVQNTSLTHEALGSGGVQWRISYTVSENDQEGVVECHLILTDANGNSRDYVPVSVTGGVVIDTTRPQITNAYLNSDNNPDTIAGPGSVVSLALHVDQSIPSPSVSFHADGVQVENAPSYSKTGNVWTASYVASPQDAPGSITYEISYHDLAGNIGVPFASGLGGVTFDRLAPAIVSSALSADGARQNLVYAGNVVTLSLQTSEALKSISVAFANAGMPASATPSYVAESSNQWSVSYIVDTADAGGLVSSTATLVDLAGNETTSELLFSNCENIFHETELRSARASTAFSFADTNDILNLNFVRAHHAVALHTLLDLGQIDNVSAPILAQAYTMAEKRLRRKAVLEACFHHLQGCEEGVLISPQSLGLELPEGKTNLIAFAPNTVVIEGAAAFPNSYAVLYGLTLSGDSLFFRSASLPVRRAHLQYTVSATQVGAYTFEGQDAAEIFGVAAGTPVALYDSFTVFGATYFLSSEINSGVYESGNVTGDPTISPLFGPLVTLPLGSEKYLLFDNRDRNERLVVNVKVKILSGPDHKKAARNVGYAEQHLRMSFMKYLIIYWKDSWRCFDIDAMAWTDAPTRSKVDGVSQMPETPEPWELYPRLVQGKKRMARTCILRWETAQLGPVELIVSTYPKHPGLRNGVSLRCPSIGDTNNAKGALVACRNPRKLELRRPFTFLPSRLCTEATQPKSTSKTKALVWPDPPPSIAEENAKNASLQGVLTAILPK